MTITLEKEERVVQPEDFLQRLVYALKVRSK